MRSVRTEGEDADEHLSNLNRIAVNYFLARRLSQTNKRIVGDKTTFAGEDEVAEIGALYPEAKVIHTVRGGRDVAVSMIHHMWNYLRGIGVFYDLDPEDLKRRDAYRKNPTSALATGLFTEKRLKNIARSWAARVGEAAERGPALLGANYAEVRYENLLSTPVEQVSGLLRFLRALKRVS